MKRWLLILALPLMACATPLPHASVLQAERAAQRWPGLTQNDLELGRATYLARCGSCHRHYEPKEYSAAHWTTQIQEMGGRAKLTAAQSEAVLKYLLSVRD